MIADLTQRKQALDPTQSFIVQAPAGSGKTELLTQRYLKLLSTVNRPEAILAITFTKKAVHEMRERLLTALKTAQAGLIPESDHAKTTYHLAQAVLIQNTKLNWQLLDNPNRLRIQTIDAFCMNLNKQLPILSGFGATPQIHQQPELLYRQAVTQCLAELEENTPRTEAIKTLLMHCDNQFYLVENLLCQMLASRDQWLPHIFNQEKLQRKALEGALQRIIQKTLNTLNNAFNIEQKALILDALLFASQYVDNTPIASINKTHTLDAQLENLPCWRAACELLLTKDNTWRKQFTVRVGLISKSNDKTALNESKRHKNQLKTLIETAQKNKTYLQALSACRSCPPAHYTDAQWHLLSALTTLLPTLCAHLKVVFSEHQAIDYTENALSALNALGTASEPTDLALSLDDHIQHILMDEFQDTSLTQLRLLEKLTFNWQPNDGHTLFIVGDPMQSIYLFRQANVGIFLQIKAQGIHQIKLTSLTLSSNFRSSQQLVNWMNDLFQEAFPNHANINTGAVQFSKATAIKTHASHIQCQHFADSHYEAEETAHLIEKILQKDPNHSIAILVRARSHCQALLQALRKASIAYQSVDLDPLLSRPVITDCLMLTRALCHLSDRVAWLAVLRAPYCGLTLADLLILSETPVIFSALQVKLKQLSPAGIDRASWMYTVLAAQLAKRGRLSLGDWVYETWQQCRADRYYTSEIDQQDAKQFFDLLNHYDQGGDMSHWPEFYAGLNQLFASADHESNANVQIMTIHKSKGLEFDTVILPQLQAKPAPNQSQLLLWHERLLKNNETDLLLAPIKESKQKHDQIYQFIQSLETEKHQYELCRLLYVACTRARTNLYCFACLDHDEETQIISNPASRSLLQTVWPSVLEQFTPAKPITNKNDYLREKQLHRFNQACFSTLPRMEITKDHQANSNYLWQPKVDNLIGTCVHQLLQQLVEHSAKWWQTINKKHHCEQQLKQLGLNASAMPNAIETAINAIESTLNDAKGQWILRKHPVSLTEYELTGLIDGTCVSGIIDRLFIDENETCWIVDYKLVLRPITDFLTHSKQYAAQLALYQQLIENIMLDAHPHGNEKASCVFPKPNAAPTPVIFEPERTLEPSAASAQGSRKHTIKTAIYYPLQAKFIELKVATTVTSE